MIKKIIIISLVFIAGFLGGFFANQKIISKKTINIEKSFTINQPSPSTIIGQYYNNQNPTPSATPIITSLPTTASPAQESLPVIRIPYQPKTNWQIYKDKIAGFSFQYQNIPTGESLSYEKINYYKEGEKVNITSCFTPKQNPSHTELCSTLYEITIYNNYDGSSRRIWFKNNLNSFYQCNLPIYYADIYLNNINGLFITSECNSSWGSTYLVFPKGKLMIVIYKNGLSLDTKTKEIKIDDIFYQRLTTFKFD
ncbi:MAG: hypothetical protein N2482_00520 [Patescibacteria group bacterium]|nr:hypothetical protein [Patescibacteria group bacterium]